MIRDTPSSAGSSVVSLASGVGGGGDEDPPGQSAFAPFSQMEEFLDKLKLLNYDDYFSKNLKIRPLNRHYFALQTNPGEQFFMFTSLAAWLFSKAGLSMEAPQESDDPNSLIATILDLTHFPPNKLKQGYGQHVIYILDAVADRGLKQNKFNFKRPQPPKEVTTEEVIVEDDSELLLEKIEEEMIAEMSSEDEDALMNIEDLHRMNNISFQDSSSKPDHVLESNVDETEWRLEVERVLPLLRVTLKSDTRDWRSHLDQIRSHKQKMEDTMKSAQTHLEKLSADMSTSLDKIAMREKMLNTQLTGQLAKFRTAQDELRHATESSPYQYKEGHRGVEIRTQISKHSNWSGRSYLTTGQTS
ncbi:hypothetical protein M8J76_012136 [Diaphorina citri]|nr:hypothetical protein M8J76_012136 [Diaphorina citri]